MRVAHDLIAAAAHGVSALALLAVPRPAHVHDVVLTSGARVDPMQFAAAAALWSSACHLVAARLIRSSGDGDFDHTAVWRWIDFTVSASIMVVPAAVYVGARSAARIGGAAAAMAGVMLAACVVENVAVGRDVRPLSSARTRGLLLLAALPLASGGLATALASAATHASTDAIVAQQAWAALGCLVVLVTGIDLAVGRATCCSHGAFAAAGAVSLYASVWAAVCFAPDVAANGVVGGLLVGTHALFGPLLFAAVAWEAAARRYDVINSAISVFCKVTMHWLTFATSAGDATAADDAGVLLAVAGGLVAGCCVPLLATAPGSTAARHDAPGVGEALL